MLSAVGTPSLCAVGSTPTALPNPSDAKLKLKRIDNMDIYTRNVDRLVDFYTKTLGLHFFLPYEPDKEWAAIDFGNVTVYIFKADRGEYAPRRLCVGRVPGFDSFAFEVENVDEAIRALDTKVEWCQDETQTWVHPSGTHYRYRAFYDPDGNKMYVTEPHKVPSRVTP